MNKIKFDKDLVFSILLAEVVGFFPLLILALLSFISWWLVYVLCVSLLIPVCYTVIKKYKENPTEIIDLLSKLLFIDENEDNYDYYENEDEDDNRII